MPANTQYIWSDSEGTGRNRYVLFRRAMAPRARRLLDGLRTLANPATGLVDWHGSYIDICAMERSGENCAVNCFVQRAFAEGASLLAALGDPDAAGYAIRAGELATIIRREFWDAERNVFTDRRVVDNPETTPSVPANTLPLLFDITDAAQAPRALAWICDAIQHNQLEKGFRVNTSFAFHVLSVLYKNGCVEEAESFMRMGWGQILDGGATTWWEYFDDHASSCHAWSGGPTYHLSAAVLGVTFPEPGNSDMVRIAPHPGTLTWAEGDYPHPRGVIHVAWEVADGQLNLRYTAPDDVIVREGGLRKRCSGL